MFAILNYQGHCCPLWLRKPESFLQEVWRPDFQKWVVEGEQGSEQSTHIIFGRIQFPLQYNWIALTFLTKIPLELNSMMFIFFRHLLRVICYQSLRLTACNQWLLPYRTIWKHFQRPSLGLRRWHAHRAVDMP